MLALQREVGNRSVWAAMHTAPVAARVTEELKPMLEPEQVTEQPDGQERQEPAPEAGTIVEAARSARIHWGRADLRPVERVAIGARRAVEAIAAPRELSWGSPQTLDDFGEDISEAIVGSIQKSLKFVQNVAFFDAHRLGVTTFPINSKSPTFDFGTSSKKKAGKTEWFAKPKLTRNANEGDSEAYHIGPGLHKTTRKEFVMVPKGGKGKKAGKAVKVSTPVYLNMSKAMSALDRDAENEHSNDFKRAYEISLLEAETVLKSSVVGKQFGPKPTLLAAKNLVLKAITDNLTNPKLGNDQAKWATKYTSLQDLTEQRDKKGWHTFGLANRKVKGGKVTYTVTKGGTKINVVKSKTLVKY